MVILDFTVYLPLLVGFFLSYRCLTFVIDLPTYRKSLKISFRIGLVLMNSCNFCLPEKFLLSPSTLNHSRIGWSIPRLQIVPFQHLKYIIPLSLVCKVSEEKSTYNLMEVPLYMTFFFLVPLEFSLTFAILIMMSWCGFVWVPLDWDSVLPLPGYVSFCGGLQPQFLFL